ncbi:MAG: hypothetical protein LBD94_02280 [Rickettsiales bacterium]|jgi:hypothetical protein|nr:hypothetical protein [Rickettsiales bacterium]
MKEAEWKIALAKAVNGKEAEELKIVALRQSIASAVMVAEQKIKGFNAEISRLVNTEITKLKK